MNENAQKWVAALRSGDYKQGKGVLHSVTRDTWCCLGVAADLFCKENPGEVVRSETAGLEVFQRYSVTSLPPVIQDWLGLAGALGDYAGRRALAFDNDSPTASLTFEQIADLIESEPPGLFVKTEAGA